MGKFRVEEQKGSLFLTGSQRFQTNRMGIEIRNLAACGGPNSAAHHVTQLFNIYHWTLNIPPPASYNPFYSTMNQVGYDKSSVGTPAHAFHRLLR
jgi:hypothetical protein